MSLLAKVAVLAYWVWDLHATESEPRHMAMTGSDGSYTLTGFDAELTASHASLSAAQGAYTLTGQTALFSRSAVLTAETGFYNLTGTSIVLRPPPPGSHQQQMYIGIPRLGL